MVWSVGVGDKCSIVDADAVTHMYPSQHMDPEVLDHPSASLAGLRAYDIALDAEDDWDLSDIPPSS